MANNKPYVGDVGTDFIIDTTEDLSTATTLELHVLKPDGTEAQWSGSVDSTTKIKYTTIAGDLDVAGVWALNAYVVTPSWDGLGETFEFEVFAKYK